MKKLAERDKTRKGENMKYYGIDNEIVDSLPEEIWETWEGAEGEIRRIIEETIKKEGIDDVI